jgi:hypothetical protein
MAAQRRSVSGGNAESVSAAGSPAITWRSAAQSPKSISLQRSLQNGRHALAWTQATGARHTGHSTTAAIQNAHSDRSNGTSRSIDFGFRSRPAAVKRIQSM